MPCVSYDSLTERGGTALVVFQDWHVGAAIGIRNKGEGGSVGVVRACAWEAEVIESVEVLRSAWEVK